MPTRKPTVLIVDDDPRMLRLIQRTLKLEGYLVLTANNGQSALDIFDQESPDMILLDVMMPGMDGYAVCRTIRQFSQIPIVMVTAKDNEEETVQGLDAGADDYVTKPFSTRELVARLRAVLRRSMLWDERPEPEFSSDELTIDFAGHRVTLRGLQVNLTATEYKLLSYLARNAGRLVTPDQILENVWGENYVGESHLLQVTIARLRQKLDDDARNPRYIMTKLGIGYTMIKKT